MRAPVTAAGTAAALAGLGLTVANLAALRVPPAYPPRVTERVAVLLPVRDEAYRLEPALRALVVAARDAGAELVVLDDGSTDGTAGLVAAVAPSARLLTGAPPPPGRLGKPWACTQLAAAVPDATVLVFVDADVVLAPHAVTATVAMLRSAGLDLVSPYPRQLAGTAAERLVQPLLQWSWMTTLPLRLAERSPRPSLAAANGQLLAVDAAAYRRAGGHAAVRGQVLDDL
ncbi:MAG TPA: glycosyltransferase, partial [Pseudonocardiaceae bacterium]